MKNIKKRLSFLFKPWFILGLQTIISALAIFYAYRLQILPDRYFYLAIYGVIVLLILEYFLVLVTRKRVQVFFKILSILISVSLIVGSYYFIEGKRFISDLTGNDKDLHEVSVIVNKDSEYKKLNDVKDLTFLANLDLDQTNIDKTVEEINKKEKFEPNLKNTNYETLGNTILNSNEGVAIISESHRDLIEEQVPGFTDGTRVIATITFEEQVAVDTPDVDVESDTFSVFVTGIDTYGPVSKVSRSDVNMIMTVNPKNGQILLTSIPRDYHVVLGTKGALDKLTHAGIYGVGESMATLEKLLDINIDYYIKVNFTSVKDVVNALGGVDVYSRYSFVTASKSYTFSKGINSVDGDKALAFVRERYNLPNGDNDRVFNQQELIKGILNKAMSPKIITNYSQILNSVKGSMQMSIPEADFTNLIRNQLDTNQSWEILQYQLKGTGSHSSTTHSMPGPSLYVMEPDMTTVNTASSLIKAMENNEIISVSQ